ALGSGGGIDDREKSFEQNFAYFVARNLAALGSTYQASAQAEDIDCMAGGGVIGKQRFFSGAGLLPKRMELQCIQLPELALRETGYGEIHVVAAQKKMIADGNAFELQFAALFGDRDQSEIGSAAADVDDQDEV